MRSNNKSGFTLIEMMVAVALFVVVALIASSTLIAVSTALRRAQNMKVLTDQVSIAMDSMTLRMTTKNPDDFVCTLPCNPSNTISFTQGGLGNVVTYTYSLSGGVIQFRKEGASNLISPLTASTLIWVNRLNFYVMNDTRLDRATVVVDAQLVNDPSTRVIMQTTIVSP